MHQLTHGWSLEPLALVMLVLVVLHEIGLRRLLRRTRPDRVRARRRQSFWFYAGAAIVMVAVLSPLEQRGYEYFYIRTVQHLLLMFAAPVLIVTGAPWQALLLGTPLGSRRRILPWLLHNSRAGAIRSFSRALIRPSVAVACFNVVMVGSLLPAVFDFSERTRWVHVWLLNGGYLLVGVLFWLLILPSPPLRARATPGVQVVALLVTNAIMWVLAIAMATFTNHAWYSVYAHVPGAALSQTGDQQLGAGILWVCGDLWAVPPLVFAAYKVFTQQADTVESTLNRLVGLRGGVGLDPDRQGK